MTTSSTSNSGSKESGNTAQVITPELLTLEQRKLVDSYIAVSGVSGLLMGALLDKYPWNLRCLLLDGGVLKLLRFSAPDIAGQAEVFKAMGAHLKKLSVLSEKYCLEGLGVNSGRFWSLRNYHQNTLAELTPELLRSKGFAPQTIAAELVQIVHDMGRDGIVHGNLCPSNVGIEAGLPVLLDHCFAAFSSELRNQRLQMAPEVRGKGAISPRADVYGLGLVLHHLLGKSASERQQETIATMVQIDAYARPETKSLLGIFTGEEQAASSGGGRKRQNTFYVGGTRNADEVLDWAKNTMSLSADIISKIQQAVAGQTSPEELAKLGQLLSKTSGGHAVNGKESEVKAEQVTEPANKSASDPRANDPVVKSTAIENPITEKPEVTGAAKRWSDLLPSGFSEAEKLQATETSAPLAVVDAKPEGASISNHAAPASTAPNATNASKLQQGLASLTNTHYALIAVALIFFVFLVYSRGMLDGFLGDSASYSKYWRGGIPSRMVEVARAAVESGDKDAQDIIVGDVLAGGNPPRVQANFLRAVFDPKWESELTEEDREAALRIGLASLDEELLSEGEPDFLEHHPALSYAKVLSEPLQSMDASVAEVPLSRLKELPGSVGGAFGLLEAGGVTTLQDPAARSLIHLLGGDYSLSAVDGLFRGASDVDQIHPRFLLLYGLAASSKELRDLYAQLLKKQRGGIEPFLAWFEKGQIAKWDEVPLEAKLAVIAGMFSGVKLETEHFAELLAFPNSLVRKAAAGALASKLGKGEAAVLPVLTNDKLGLSRAQIACLATALTLNGEGQYVLLSQFFDTGPEVKAVVELVLARSAVDELDPFSIEAARYLSSREWQGTPEEFGKMLTHQEAMVRVLPLSKLDASKPNERALLEAAMKRETNEKLKKQLELKLSDTPLSQ